MKTLKMCLFTPDGDEIGCFALEEFAIAEAWDESDETDNQTIIEHGDALYRTLLRLLREQGAAPCRGSMWLKLALGEALLTADEYAGDIELQVVVQPLSEEEEDEFDDSF